MKVDYKVILKKIESKNTVSLEVECDEDLRREWMLKGVDMMYQNRAVYEIDGLDFDEEVDKYKKGFSQREFIDDVDWDWNLHVFKINEKGDFIFEEKTKKNIEEMKYLKLYLCYKDTKIELYSMENIKQLVGPADYFEVIHSSNRSISN